MKRIIASLVAFLMVCGMSACGGDSEAQNDISASEETISVGSASAQVTGKLSPVEMLDQFIVENGEDDGEEIIFSYPDAKEFVKKYDFTIAALENVKGTPNVEFNLIKGDAGIAVSLVDANLTDNGMKMERTIVINPDGTFVYNNMMAAAGSNIGVTLEGEIAAETYTKDIQPVITNSEFVGGGKMSTDVQTVLKQYVDMTLDCYAEVLSQEGLGLTLADMGYISYVVGQ